MAYLHEHPEVRRQLDNVANKKAAEKYGVDYVDNNYYYDEVYRPTDAIDLPTPPIPGTEVLPNDDLGPGPGPIPEPSVSGTTLAKSVKKDLTKGTKVLPNDDPGPGPGPEY